MLQVSTFGDLLFDLQVRLWYPIFIRLGQPATNLKFFPSTERKPSPLSCPLTISLPIDQAHQEEGSQGKRPFLLKQPSRSPSQH